MEWKNTRSPARPSQAVGAGRQEAPKVRHPAAVMEMLASSQLLASLYITTSKTNLPTSTDNKA